MQKTRQEVQYMAETEFNTKKNISHCFTDRAGD